MVRRRPRRELLFEPLSWRPVRPPRPPRGRSIRGRNAFLTTTPHKRRSHAVFETCGKRPLTTPYRNVKGLRMQFCFQAKSEALGFIVRCTIETLSRPPAHCTGNGDILQCSILLRGMQSFDRALTIKPSGGFVCSVPEPGLQHWVHLHGHCQAGVGGFAMHWRNSPGAVVRHRDGGGETARCRSVAKRRGIA